MGSLTRAPAHATEALRAPELRVRALRKSFGRTEVLHGVDLTIEPGSFVGLMGPNGAGKSTLVKILAGVYPASSGTVEIGGSSVASLAGRSDVGFIHQDLGLPGGLSVADNLRLGRSGVRHFGLIDRRAERELAATALARVGLDIDPRSTVAELSPGEQALVAVARALDSGARLLVVDEATSTLAPRDAALVIDALRNLVDSGASVIMVSHRLQEIIDVTRRIVILIDGLIASDHRTADINLDQLVALLSPKSLTAGETPDKRPDAGPVLLQMSGIRSGKAGPFDLALRGHELIGITGRPGSGLYDIGFVAAGIRPATAGTIESPRRVRAALVPPHRESQGGMPTMSVRANLTLTSVRTWRARTGLLRRGRERHDAQQMAERLNVVPVDVSTEFATLSGGNKQKVILGRALFAEPDVYVLCEPTRGVDVGTRHEIYALIRRTAAAGAAVLVISSDAEDLLSVCDRVGVVEDGRIGELWARADLASDDLKAVL